MMQFYDDGVVQLDRAALTLRRYHFPSGTAKVIPLDQIRGYQAESLGFLMARFNIWGRPDLRRWLPLDVYRPLKSTLVTLDVPGMRPKPACTPTRPKEFIALLDELLALHPNVNPRFRARFSHCPGAQPHSRLKPQRRSKRRVMCLV